MTTTPDATCNECKNKMHCACCGDQLCQWTQYTCETKGHYVSASGPLCVECHQLELVKGKIG